MVVVNWTLPLVCVHVCIYMWLHKEAWLSHRLGYISTDSPSFLFSLLRPHVFADQLNSTGIPHLPSLHLVPEEEAESEEGDDYY